MTEKLDERGATLEHTPQNSQETGISKSTAVLVTKLL
jgi:hypothetical protein